MGEPVLDVLWSKTPEARALFYISLNAYSCGLLKLVDVNLTEDTVIQITRGLSGVAGLGGANSASL